MANTINQTPEQTARDKIDAMLTEAGWVIQSNKNPNVFASDGVAVREYPTEVGPADYVLFVEGEPVGVIEAKREEEGLRMTIHEDQAEWYAKSRLKHLENDPLPFVYESTGVITRFMDCRDPKPRSRPVFAFHRPETLREWRNQDETLRKRLQKMPPLPEEGLRKAQITAIRDLEKSFAENRPKALIQMATGAGKTFTACTFVYRLLKFADAGRVLFLVDTRNLGEQAESEFLKYVPGDDNRKFTELYNVRRLTSGFIPSDSQVCISTIQRLYSILQGRELDEKLEEENPNEADWKPKEPVPVEYNAKNPVEQFDFIIVDECHRSIYNLWKQVLEYYDAFLIGLTATPDVRTYAFFNENVVSEYTHDQSVIDGVNVPYDVFSIETKITKEGGTIAKQLIEKRERLSRRKRWELMDEDFKFTPNQLDRDVMNPSQIRNIIKTFKNKLPEIFPDRLDENGEFEVPKSLIFAKTDGHADDIIEVVREEFAEGNDFCKKVTYKAEEDPKSVLSRFRNSWNPRIAVTVDMIATGTDVKPLEVLLFMRDVRSRNYYEQMKGRGTRTISFDDLKRVTRTARHTKTHFVIVDAVGVERNRKTDSRPLERKPSVPLKDLLQAVSVGNRSEDLFSSLANRLIRLEKMMTDDEKAALAEKTGGRNLNAMAKALLDAHNPDVMETETRRLLEKIPEAERTPETEKKCADKAERELAKAAAVMFTGDVNDYIENVRRVHEQYIDTVNKDEVLKAEFDTFTREKAAETAKDFADYLRTHKDEIKALGFYYDQPHRLKEVTFKMIKEVLTALKRDKPMLAPHYVWDAYARLEDVKGESPENELVALVSLIRRVTGLDDTLTPYDKTVNVKFKNWIFKRHKGAGEKFTEEQMAWLRMLKDHIATSFHVDVDDLDYTPFDAQGGVGKMYALFGDETNDILDEMNEALAA